MEAAKKILLLMVSGQAIKAYPPPFELSGRWNVGTLEKRSLKSSFFLNGPAFYPSPGPPPS